MLMAVIATDMDGPGAVGYEIELSTFDLWLLPAIDKARCAKSPVAHAHDEPQNWKTSS